MRVGLITAGWRCRSIRINRESAASRGSTTVSERLITLDMQHDSQAR